MSNIEKAKENVRITLEKNFVDNIGAVKREMGILNMLIGAFTNNAYTYDEYCVMRMKFEIEACDKVVDIDVDEGAMERDMAVIQRKVIRKLARNPEIDYEKLMEQEYVKLHLDRCQQLDKEMFYQISKHSSIKLLQEKIPADTWNAKKGYFEDICEAKANKIGEAVAAANKDMHEQNIRVSLM